MKTFQLFLIACVVQMMSAIGAWANSFSDMKLIVELNQTMQKDIPATLPMIDLSQDGREAVFELHGVSIRTASKAKQVDFQYKIYRSGETPTDTWQELQTGEMNEHGMVWRNTSGPNVLEGLEVGSTYILEFRMKGINPDDSEFFYDNGHQNYKIKFTKGKAPKIKFAGGQFNSVTNINVDGVDKRYLIPSESAWNGFNLGKASSIIIKDFSSIVDKYTPYASVNQLNITYGICKKGEEVDYFYSTPATRTEVEYQSGYYIRERHIGDTPVDIMARMNELYPDGLMDGGQYDMVIGFSFTDNEGNLHSLDNDDEGFRYSFTYSATPLGPDDRAEFTHTFIHLYKNEEFTGIGLMQADNYNFDLTGVNDLWGLRLQGFSTYPSYTANEVKLNYRIYEGTTPTGNWKSLSATSNGTEVIEWSYDDEPVDMLENKEVGKTYTLEYFLSGVTTTGKRFYQNNNGNNFTIKYKPAPATEHFNYVKLQATAGLNNAVEEVEINLPPRNMQIEDISDNGIRATNVLTVTQITADMSVEATAFDFYYSVYQYGSEPAEWKNVSGTSADGRTWTCTSAVDVMAGLAKDKNYVLEFYFKATVNGSDAIMNNGNENYKVQFLYADKDPDTGGTGFTVDGRKMVSFVMTSDLDNPYMFIYDLATCKSVYENGAVQLGRVPKLAFTAFRAMWQRESTDVEIADMSIQYKIYEPGQDGQWNGIMATETNYYIENQLIASSTCHEAFTFPGLISGNTYILELMPQLRTSNNKYYFLKDTDEGGNVGFKFQFTIDNPTGITTVNLNSSDSTPAYNLAGQRVADSYKGIVIQNNKKIWKR